MARYDRGRGYGRQSGYDRTGGSDYSSWGSAWSSRPGGGLWGGDQGMNRFWGIDGGEGGYDRGIYGEGYPSYGGFPGGQQRGMYYGGRGGPQRGGGYDFGAGYDGRYGFLLRGRGGYDRDSRGYDAGFGGGYGGGGYGGGYGAGRGDDTGYARLPFVPEEAYRQHPELSRQRGPDYTGGMEDGFEFEVAMDDDEIRQAVRQSLHQDSWVQPDLIQVEVNGGVVTLTGEVDDYMQARYAWDDAWETDGVRGVLNHLTVRTDQPHEQHGDVVPQSSGGKRKK